MTQWRHDYELDFSGQRKTTVLGWVLLALGVLVCGLVLVLYFYSLTTWHQAQVLQDKMRQSERTSRPVLVSVAADEGLKKRWLDAAKHMNMPWHTLFLAFEAVPDKNIILLSFEPEASTGTVRVTGLARSLAHLQRYIEQLTQDSSLQQVLLQSYKQAETEGQLRFVLQARWIEERALP